MISVTRSLLRQFQRVCRRARISKSSASLNSAVVFRTGEDGLRIQAMLDQVAVEYHQSGSFDSGSLIVPAGFLGAAAGSSDDKVTLERDGDAVCATWNDHGIPQVAQYGPVTGRSPIPAFPALPAAFESNSPELCMALQSAVSVVPNERTRYALDCLQLRGLEGKIVATDGRQVLAQGGFRFPWTDDLLIPASPVFAARELSQQSSVEVGVAPDWIAFRLGPWTVWLRIDRSGRFPKVDDLFHSADTAVTKLSIDPRDAQFIDHSLPRMPGAEGTNSPITLDLNGHVALRGKTDGRCQATEFVLSRSSYSGQALTVNSNREYLARAVKLGFREISLFNNTSPVLCDDGRRQYLWGLLEADGVVRADDDSIRVESSQHPSHEPADRPKQRRRTSTVQHTSSENKLTHAPSGRQACRVSTKPSAIAPQNATILQAISLRTSLRETLAHTRELIRALKREKRQQRLVASTLASLKQLHKVA